MTNQGLGEFEQTILVAIVRLGESSTAVSIVEEIEKRTGRRVSRAAVYITLRRLEEKGYVSSWLGQPTPERGGKAKRHVRLEPGGARALRNARQMSDRMWQDVDPALLRLR